MNAPMVFRPYPGIYLRWRDVFTTGMMLATFLAVVWMAEQNGRSTGDTIVLGVLAGFLIVIRAASFLTDASLRRRTRYELRDGALHIFRDDELVTSIDVQDLDRLRPESVDRKGIGSVELPYVPLSEMRSLNQWRVLVPALYAAEELTVVPSISDVCARIRAEARSRAAA